MSLSKIAFIDRDGTIIVEPEDKQIDSLEKLELLPGAIPALLQMQNAGYKLIMVSNQDGLGTASFPEPTFTQPQQKLLQILNSQGIVFHDILICPHFSKDNCECRKPKLGLVMNYVRDNLIDKDNSVVIGDRQTDIEFANNLGIKGILYTEQTNNWPVIINQLVNKPRAATIERNTKETQIKVSVNLDANDGINVQTGLGFFDHMLEQLAKHGGFSLEFTATADLHIDEHHLVEDAALAIGQALRKALGDKLGIQRYGFLLAMDEALAQVAIDLSGRAYFVFEGQFERESVGQLATELVPHFFRSLADSLAAAINIKVTGENCHHKIESIFKGVGRALRMAIKREGYDLPTTKGQL